MNVDNRGGRAVDGARVETGWVAEAAGLAVEAELRLAKMPSGGNPMISGIATTSTNTSANPAIMP